MGYFIDGTWADWFWSCEAGRSGRCAAPSQAALGQSKVPSPEIMAQLLASSPFRTFPEPVPMLVDRAAKRPRPNVMEAHVIGTPLPSNAFRSIGDGFYIAGPELAFVELAQKLCLSETIAVGYEYCGTYAMNPAGGKALFDVEPVTTVRKLSNFVDRVPAMRGSANARKAIDCIREGSASPFETLLHMRFSLTGHRGGYSLETSLINHEIVLDDTARRIYKRGSCRCDLYFPKVSLDVEYNGKEHESQTESDAARAAALGSMGIRTLVVTKRQYDDFLAMSGIVRSISHDHGTYLSEARTGYTAARGKLYSELQDYLSCRNRL